MSPPAPALEIVGATMFGLDGLFEQRTLVVDEAGRFAAGGDGRLVLDAAGLWAIPGVYDCHSHITWNDFHHDQRERKSQAQRDRETADALAATLRGGVLNLRDAGGAPKSLQDAVASGALAGPRLQISVEMIGATHAGTADTMRGHVEAAIGLGAQWIKLVATAGSSTPGDAVLASNFSEAEIKAAAETAAEGGARVMIHTWGGDSADWAIEHGATSIEHGIYLTPTQVRAAAAAGMTFVPTITIYRHVRDMVLAGQLDGVAFGRIVAVIAAHEDVVQLADREGLPLAIGSDFTTPQQHGTNLIEIAALIRAGIAPVTALLAATAHGAALFGDADGGRIEPGARADLVLLSADPTEPATFEDPAHVVGVLKDGRLAYLDPALPRPTPQERSHS